MELKPIKTERQYNKALAEIDALIDCKPGSKEEDRLVVISLLVEAYESEHYPIPPPDPIEAIRFRMEQMGLKEEDLGKLVGGTARAKELLRGKRKLTLAMMRALHSKLGVPAETLLAA